MKSKYKKGDIVYIKDGYNHYYTKYKCTNKLGNIVLSNKEEYIYDDNTKEYYCKYDRETKIITKKEYIKLTNKYNRNLKRLIVNNINRELKTLYNNQVFNKENNFTEDEKLEFKQFVMNIVDRFLSRK